ncbi:MAG: hypothetical protein ACLFXM_15915, partial [Acidimicrobiia bacterium]
MSFPAPSPERCPACEASLDGIRCPRCGLVLSGEDAAALWWIDSELHDLTVRRRQVLGRLYAAQAASSGPSTSWVPHPPAPPSTSPGAAAPPPPFPPPEWRAPPAWLTAMSLPNLLLGLGTALVIVAAIVFTAVQWSHLSSVVQALVLLGLTVGTGWATGALRHRGLTATGEALSVIVVAMLLVDVHAVREAAGAVAWGEDLVGDALVYWCLATWAIAAFTLWFGRTSATRAPRIIAAVAAQVPVPLYVVGRPVEAISGQLLCLAQVALVVVAIHHAPRAVRWARRAGALGAAGTWFVVTPVAAAIALAGGPMERLGGAGVLAAAAAVAGLVAALWRGDETVRAPA